MKTFTQPAREIPVAAQVDVLVVGGGTAGVCAAIASARNGANTMIVEQFGFLGGTQTAALVGPLAPNYHADGSPLTTGIGQEIFDRMAGRGAAEGPVDGKYPELDWPWFDPEMLKYVLDEMCEEAGVKVLYHSFLSDAIVVDGVLKGIVVENKSGSQAIFAKVTVDATGDGDVAWRAGAPWESGRKSDGANQAVSLRFHMGNVDWKRAGAFLRENGVPPYKLPTVAYADGGGLKELGHVINKAREEGVVPHEVLRYFQFFAVEGRPGEIAFNCPELRNLQGTDGWDVARMQIQGRKMVLDIIKFCKTCIPGFENAYLVFTAPMPGIRSSRRILGEYILNDEDVVTGRKFEDAIARNNWPPDIHAPKNDDGLYFKQTLEKGDYVDVPYGCLVAQKIDNLLVAGRCISTTFEAQSAIRIARTCQALGQAAGTAAAMAAKQAVTPRALPGKAVRAQLEKDGLF